MKRIVPLLICALLLSGWDRGAAPSAVVCTFATGNCAGTGGGSSLFTPGTCDGSTDDTLAFKSFHDWAVGTWQVSNTGQIKLVLPASSTCLINSANSAACGGSGAPGKCPFINIKNLLVSGPTTTISDPNGNVNRWGGIGIAQDNSHDLPTASVTAGNSCVTLQLQSPVLTVTAVTNISGTPQLTVSPNTTGYSNGQTVFLNNTTNSSSNFLNGNDITVNVVDSTHLNVLNRTFSSGYTSGAQIGNVTSPFSLGQPVIMTGLSLQAFWANPFGFPPNVQYWEFLHVASINSGTGQICFTTPLANTYLSTWPRYNSGNQFQVDPGGPATLYANDPSWDATVEFDIGTLNTIDQAIAANNTIIWNGVNFPTQCAIPSENAAWKAININTTGCGEIEIDKLIDTMVVTNSTIASLKFQSASVKTLQLNGSTLGQLQGSPIVTTGGNNTFTSVMKPGAVSYGRSTSFGCSNCIVASLVQGGITDNGGNQGVQNTYFGMSAGVIQSSNGTTISGAVSNGGFAELTVASTAGFRTGQYLTIQNTDGNIYDGFQQVTVTDSTHLTLGKSFTATTLNGQVEGGAVAWAVPGANIMLAGPHGVEAIGQVTTVTQDANLTYIATTFSGGFPPDVTTIETHPAPIFNCPGCTGADPQIASVAQAPANAPLFSYQTYTYPGSNGTAVQNLFAVWGTITNFEMNVTAPSSSASTFHASQFDNWPVYSSGTLTSAGPTVNSHVSGDRKVNSSGAITCNGSAGACDAGDNLSGLAGLWFPGVSNSGPAYSGTPGSASVTFTFQTNQGVVN